MGPLAYLFKAFSNTRSQGRVPEVSGEVA
uniref:Uncharacterized protein n=1 Tax=Ralstonia solanacearum TaxID=305 RepID=A0A0S4TN74_RALSL|nr:protein of unknown function [Ralstonia solanacearum]